MVYDLRKRFSVCVVGKMRTSLFLWTGGMNPKSNLGQFLGVDIIKLTLQVHDLMVALDPKSEIRIRKVRARYGFGFGFRFRV